MPILLQSLIFARFQGGKVQFLAVRFFFFKYPSVEFHFGVETASLRAPDVAFRGVCTVSYFSGLECILPISNSYFLLEFSTNAYL